MPAPKGNKFGKKENPKTRYVGFFMRPEAAENLKKIATSAKIPMTQVIEKALLTAHPKEFDGLF